MSDETLRNKNNELIRNWIIGGGLAGGGIAALTGLIRRYNQDKARMESAEDTSKDDDILYVRVPRLTQQGADVPKLAGVLDDSLSASLAFAGLPLSGILAYTAVDQLMRKAERQKVQKELDEAQQIFLGRLKAEAQASKTAKVEDAGSPVSTGQTVLGTLGAMPILAAVASGVLTNQLLRHYIPDLPKKKRKDIQPRRVVVLDEEDLADKRASYDDGVSPQEFELLIKVAATLEPLSPIGLEDVIKVAAHGGIPSLYSAAVAGDVFDAASEKASGLSEPSKTRKYAAIHLLANDSILGPQMRYRVASLVLDQSPEMCLLGKAAADLGMEDGFREIAKLASMESRLEVDITKLIPAEKVASAVGIDLSSMLQAALENAMEGDNDADEGESINAHGAGSESEGMDDLTSAGIDPKYREALDDIMAAYQTPAAL